MEISSSVYYTKNYAAAESNAVSSSANPAYDSGTLQTVEAAGDSYLDDIQSTESDLSPSQLSHEALNWGHEVFKNPDLDPSLRLRLYEGAMGLFQDLQSQGDGQAIPQSSLDTYSLLQTDYQNALQEIGAKTQAKAESQDSLTRIESLNQNIDKLLDDPELAESIKAQLQDYQKQLGKAKSSLELAADPESVSQLESSLEETFANAQDAVDSAHQAHEEKLAAVYDLMDQISASLKDAHCEKHDRLKIQQEIAKLKIQLTDGSLSLSEITKKLEDLQGDLKKAVTAQGQRDAFQGLDSLIPSNALPDAATLAKKISQAIKSGDWKSVDHFLSTMTKDDDIFHYESEIVIEQVIGALYYGPAGGDKKELKKLLDCIPEKTREKMIDTLKLNPHDWRGFGVDDNPDQKLANKIYGSKKKTIELLNDSMK